MNQNSTPPKVFALDCHPDSFTAACLSGATPACAITEKIWHKIPIAQLAAWAQKHTATHDVFVLEASGNSFQIVRTLATLQRKARVLESCHLGKLKEAHANNDRLSAVRIGKAWLAGTAKPVWVPDTKTQERRDWFHCHRKAVKRTTQVRNRLLSYLSDNGVRLQKGTALAANQQLEAQLRSARDWSPRQWQVLTGLLLELRHANEQRAHWRSLIAQEVLQDPQLLSLVRLCGIRELVAFALAAIIGDIHRFANPRKLVSYVGLTPAFDHSGQNDWTGGLAGHGRADLRCLLLESAHAILRSAHPLAKWGKKLLARKSAPNLAAAAVARKLTVAVWYLLMDRWSPFEELDDQLSRKLGKIVTNVGSQGLKELGKNRKTLKAESVQRLKTKVYLLHPPPPSSAPKQNQRKTPITKMNFSLV